MVPSRASSNAIVTSQASGHGSIIKPSSSPIIVNVSSAHADAPRRSRISGFLNYSRVFILWSIASYTGIHKWAKWMKNCYSRQVNAPLLHRLPPRSVFAPCLRFTVGEQGMTLPEARCLAVSDTADFVTCSLVLLHPNHCVSKTVKHSVVWSRGSQGCCTQAGGALGEVLHPNNILSTPRQLSSDTSWLWLVCPR